MSPKIYQALKSLFRLKKFEQAKMYFFINAEQENFLNKLKEMSENDIIEFSSSFSSFKKNEEIIDFIDDISDNIQCEKYFGEKLN